MRRSNLLFHRKRKTFRWPPTMKEDLKCLSSYKVSMDYKDKDFDGDGGVKHYATPRVEMNSKKMW